MDMKRETVEVNHVLCEIIATYHNDELNRDYIIYTDKTFNNQKKLNVFCGLYTTVNDKKIVRPLETDYDKSLSEEILQEIMNTI